MVGPLLSLATFLLVQAGAARWWASRVSADLRAMSTSVAALTARIEKLDTSVTTHETAIAIIRAMNDYERQSLNGSSHERAR